VGEPLILKGAVCLCGVVYCSVKGFIFRMGTGNLRSMPGNVRPIPKGNNSNQGKAGEALLC
jgi:hypothetical protein